jgi:isoquinoline 1-oxidoreductase beta subunit
MNSTAVWTPERCDVYCGTQNAEAALASVVQASELPITKCDVHRLGLGGGFGRRARNDYIIQSVLIAKQMPGTPVKLVWTREEDMTHCAFHPATQCKLTASVDDKGNLTGMHMRISGHSIIASLMPDRLENGMDPAVFQGLTANSPEGMFGYKVPNLLIDHAMRNSHLTAGFWRGVNANHNAIYVECFIDEVAKAAGVDPLEFRRRHLREKHLAVLNAAAAKANYGKAPKGIFQGVSQMHSFGSYTAAVADVSVTDGRVKVHRIVAATNPGHAVNPAQIERQVAGSFVYGLTAMMYGEITVKNGAVEQTNFDTYPMLRMDEMPKIEVVIVPTNDFWGGVGEPTIAVAAPAVINAIAAATGKRVRTFPLTNVDLRKA